MNGLEMMEKIKGFFERKTVDTTAIVAPILESEDVFVSKVRPELEADFVPQNYRSIFSFAYTGEKELGEMGPYKDYQPEYQLLRIRSWQAYLESELAQTVVNRMNVWAIGNGLRLQSEPAQDVLATEGIDIDIHEFSKAVEGRFRVFSQSCKSDFSEMKNLNLIQRVLNKNALLGGDMLVILRYRESMVNVQLVDGAHVQSPEYGSEFFPMMLANGNRIINGIEMDPTGKHIRYFVRNAKNEFDKIECFGEESGLHMAFMHYGLEYRVDSSRGLPLLAVVLQTLKQLERYKTVTLASAEERQKIAYYIVHGINSTGENPLISQAAKAFNADASLNDGLPKDVSGKELADLIAATTGKQTFNLPQDADVKALDAKNELYLRDFYEVNSDIVCACIGIPPEVAISKFNGSYSGSRGSIKDWEHSLNVMRYPFAFQFNQRVYNFWLHIEILRNKINAPGYLKAWKERDWMIIESYRMARFVGPQVPHIDPLKEVLAERAKLGKASDHLPLTTAEAASEALNSGDSIANFAQFAVELQDAEKLGIKMPVIQTGAENNDTNNEDDPVTDQKTKQKQKQKSK